MGQLQNQTSIDYGRNCALKFAAGETPKYVYGRFILIEACPLAPTLPPNDRTFKLTQHVSIPCLWEHKSADWWVSFEYLVGPPKSRFFIRHTPTFGWYFLGTNVNYVDQGHVFVNILGPCAGTTVGISGIGVITWRLESIGLLESLNITTAIDLFMEMFPLADGKRVYKYCKLKDSTNVKILYNP